MAAARLGFELSVLTTVPEQADLRDGLAIFAFEIVENSNFFIIFYLI